MMTELAKESLTIAQNPIDKEEVVIEKTIGCPNADNSAIRISEESHHIMKVLITRGLFKELF